MAQVDFIGRLKQLGLNGPLRAAAVGSIVARMAAPGSERATHRWLTERSASPLHLRGCPWTGGIESGIVESRSHARGLSSDASRRQQQHAAPGCARERYPALRSARHGQNALGRALAKETGWAFFPTTGYALMGRDAIDKLAEQVSDARPAIIFIDEADDILTQPIKVCGHMAHIEKLSSHTAQDFEHISVAALRIQPRRALRPSSNTGMYG
jgi:hypothetical protein